MTDTTEARRLARDLEGIFVSEDVSAVKARAIAAMLRALADENERMREALERIERWHGEFPATGKTWEDGQPMSYGAAYGSNGEREFMRDIAREALK